jgi:transposase
MAPLLFPAQRPIPQHLGEPEPPCLPAVQDRFHDVGRQACERQEPADIGIRDAFLLREIVT